MICIFRLTREQFRTGFRSPRVWLGFFIGIAMLMYPLVRLCSFSLARQEPLNILEGFLYVTLDPQNAMFQILGFLFLISDAPFINERIIQLVIRSNRKKWNFSNIIYIFAQSVLYYLILLFAASLLISKNGYLGRAWSIPLVQLTENGTLLNIKYQLHFSYMDFIRQHHVIEACALTFCGNVMYASFLGILLYAGNLGKKLPWGTWIAIVVHFAGYITRKEFIPEFSLAAYASPAENESFIPFILLLPLIAFTFLRVQTIDIYSVSQN